MKKNLLFIAAIFLASCTGSTNNTNANDSLDVDTASIDTNSKEQAGGEPKGSTANLSEINGLTASRKIK